MYAGRYYHKLDDKNRFSFPAAFRKALGKKVVITKGLEGCLFVFDQDGWSKKLEQVNTLEYNKKSNRDFIRLLTHTAEEVELDTQGRALVSSHLKAQANLNKEIVVVGSLDRIEVWDQAKYHVYLDTIEQHAEEIAESI